MNNITPTGIIKSSLFAESLVSKYDTEVYVEPDNSAWIHIFHHNNPASARFSSSNTFTSSVYLDSNRWFNLSILSKITNGTYELMIHQKITSSSTLEKYRWIQYYNPMTCSYGNVDLADVTVISTEGYSVCDN